MARRNSKAGPSYRRQTSPSGDRAFVQFGRERIYLGAYGTPESEAEYHRVVGERKANGGRAPVAPDSATITEVLDRFWEHALTYYGTVDGEPTTQAKHFKVAMGPLRKLYGRTPAKDFGPLKLKTVRDQLASGGKHPRSRRYVNGLVQRLKAVFKWAAGEELVPADVFHALQTVAGLKLGRCELPEGARVEPVDQEHVDKVLPFLSKPLRGVVRLQLLTGARGGDILKLRPIDLDMTGEVWKYRVQAHKGTWRGHSRTIHIGPEGQTVLREFLAGRAVDAFCFSPKDAIADRAAAADTHRRENQPATPRKTDRTVGDFYRPSEYRNAVARACVRAGVPHWHPHRLRHLAGTILRARYGIEVARCVLGHKDPGVTLMYAEADESKIVEAMKRIG